MATINVIGYERGLSSNQWKELVKLIQIKKCTPFIGAGACSTLPKGSDLAIKLAKEHNYPLKDNDNLQRVSQFIAKKNSPSSIKREIVEELAECDPPDYFSPTEPHSLLADLNLPVYLTTNYDDFMEQALNKRKINPEVDFMRWANEVSCETIESVLHEKKYKPSPENPLVYHLHGTCKHPNSIVLTEGDYINYMLKMSKGIEIIPPVILKSLVDSSLLFIGYSLEDWTLRVLLRELMSTITTKKLHRHVSVQLEPSIDGTSEQEILTACAYLDDYFDDGLDMEIDVYWGKAEEFISELREHWDLHCQEKKNAKQR